MHYFYQSVAGKQISECGPKAVKIANIYPSKAKALHLLKQAFSGGLCSGPAARKV
jgi:hypothetical protein